MNPERDDRELAAAPTRCWRLATEPEGAHSERHERLARVHFTDPADAIEAALELAGDLEDWDQLLGFTAAVRAGLAQQHEPCWVVRCGVCGTPLGDEDDDLTVLHFPDPTAAYQEADHQAWVVEVRSGTRMECPSCRESGEVARRGAGVGDGDDVATGGQPGDPADPPNGAHGADAADAADRVPGPGQLAFPDTGPHTGTHTSTDDGTGDVERERGRRPVLDPLAPLSGQMWRSDGDWWAGASGDAAEVSAAAGGTAAGDGDVPDEFVISPGLWSRVAVALARGHDPGPRPAVFSPDRVEALARGAPQTALRAVRVAVGWLRGPHDQRDLALCLQQWRAEPRHGHHVKAEHAAVGHGPARLAVATCGDCGYPVTRLGGPTARWMPIWPHQTGATR